MEKPKAWGRNDRPPPLGDTMHVVRLKADGQLSMVVLSNKLMGFNTHWDGRKTVRCCHPDFACQGHAQNWPLRWVGLLHCCDGNLAEQFIFEVTPLAGQKLFDLQEEKGSLRGLIVFANRQRNHKRAPVVITPKGFMEGISALPRERSCEPTALRLYAYAGSIGPREGRAV